MDSRLDTSPPADRQGQEAPRQTQNLIVLGKASFQAGYWRGMSQPATVVALAITRTTISGAALQQFDAIRSRVLPEGRKGRSETGRVLEFDHQILERTCAFAIDLLAEAGLPVLSRPATMRMPSGTWLVGLPSIPPAAQAPLEAMTLASQILNGLADGKSINLEALKQAIERMIARYRRVAPAGANTLRFIETAHRLGIPWRHLSANVYQFGWGQASRWLDSSFTDRTPVVSTRIARDKRSASAVLQAAGLPVPRQRTVTSPQAATRAAEALGYPVVVKPADLDGGAGVMAGLTTPAKVMRAFEAAAALSKRVIVEEFVPGNDYRIRVCNGQVIGVTLRRPAGLIGDGQASIAELIERTNLARAHPQSDLDPEVEQGSKPITIDEEVHDWLAMQGLTLSSVVSEGQRVRLRGAANWSLGGTIRDVTGEAHPDNLALAIRAVEALRLDIAGIDLLCPDIGRSWVEVGGAICEVNAQPQFTAEASFTFVLGDLFAAQGRIPVVVVSVPGLQAEDRAVITAALPTPAAGVRWVTTSGECRKALVFRDTAAIIWECADLPGPGHALPFDKVDAWIVGDTVEVAAGPETFKSAPLIARADFTPAAMAKLKRKLASLSKAKAAK